MNSIASNALKSLNVPFNSWHPVLYTLTSSFLGLQSIRWRKPRWLPRAPSKMYVITHRKRLPPDETKELLRLYQNYKCYMRLSIEHCIKENQIRAEHGKLSKYALDQEEEEHRKLMAYNQQENERMAALRNERLAKSDEELMEQIFKEKEEAAERAEIEKDAALHKLIRTEELVSTFIDPAKLDEAIEAAINNPIDYNFAIDEEGRVYKGRFTSTHNTDSESLSQLPVKDPGMTTVF